MGAPISDKTSQNSKNIEEFLAGLLFKQNWKIKKDNNCQKIHG
jgi:hypothetical protein